MTEVQRATQLARTQLERLGLPIFVVPGNHDSREPFREAFSSLSGMPKDGFIDWVETVEDTRHHRVGHFG